MALMMGKLYSALRSVDVPEDKAREAAEEIAGYESQLADIKSDLRMLKWAQVTTLGVSVAIFIKLFVH